MLLAASQAIGKSQPPQKRKEKKRRGGKEKKKKKTNYQSYVNKHDRMTLFET